MNLMNDLRCQNSHIDLSGSSSGQGIYPPPHENTPALFASILIVRNHVSPSPLAVLQTCSTFFLRGWLQPFILLTFAARGPKPIAYLPAPASASSNPSLDHLILRSSLQTFQCVLFIWGSPRYISVCSVAHPPGRDYFPIRIYLREHILRYKLMILKCVAVTPHN